VTHLSKATPRRGHTPGSYGHGKPGKVLEFKIIVVISWPGKVLEKNVIPKVLEKSWKCFIFIYSF